VLRTKSTPTPSTETAIYNALGQRTQISGGVSGSVLYAYDEADYLLENTTARRRLEQEPVGKDTH
jgi:hypothetical protein